jgi:hypothetical protein
VTLKVGNKAKGVNFLGEGAAQMAGRLAIWAVIGLLLIRGAGTIMESPREADSGTRVFGALADPASDALAVGFAHAYLTDPSPQALAPFLADGARVAQGWPTLGQDADLAQAEVSAIEDLGGGRTVLTVACEFRDARTLYLAVPILRSRAGEVAVQGAPWIVAAPSTAGVAAERPRPIAGSDASAIEALIEKFVPAYLAGKEAGDLAYLLAPGAEVRPLGGLLQVLALAPAAQLGDGEGSRRTVVAAGSFRDSASGAVHRLAYRLEVIRRDRWYVRAVEGTLR